MAAHPDRSMVGTEQPHSRWSYADALEVWELAVEEQQRRLDELEQVELIDALAGAEHRCEQVDPPLRSADLDGTAFRGLGVDDL